MWEGHYLNGLERLVAAVRRAGFPCIGLGPALWKMKRVGDWGIVSLGAPIAQVRAGSHRAGRGHLANLALHPWVTGLHSSPGLFRAAGEVAALPRQNQCSPPQLLCP